MEINIKPCPFCGGQVMLCQNNVGYAIVPDFSLVCMKCGVEFKTRALNQMQNCIFDPIEAAKTIVDKFNRRQEETVVKGKWELCGNDKISEVYRCTECKTIMGLQTKTKYCPECGAKMQNEE